MKKRKSFSLTMRVIHRYLGFFLVGIMAMYAISGIVLIFRDTNFLKKEKQIEKQIGTNMNKEELRNALKKVENLKQLRGLKSKENTNIYYFDYGSYNRNTGILKYKTKKLPLILEKMTHLHKAKTEDILYFFNIFFGTSLLFFVISSFWMFTPKTAIFRKGLYFIIAGMILTLVLLFI